jgi:epoxyqueuosine reductase
MIPKSKYTQLIKNEALRLGFSSVGFAKAVFLEKEAPVFEKWLQAGHHGKMQYLENHFDKRMNPQLLVEGSKTLISLSYNYFPKEKQKAETYQIAKYAYGQDYHIVLKNKLKELIEFINQNIGAVNGRAFTDTAPLLEKVWASKAGLGWQGRNSLLLQKQKGSFFSLADLIIALELDYDTPFTANHCGTCTLCVEACPTDAILPNNLINASKCISYLTIELRDEIPSEFKNQLPNTIFGCDICQDVCPWNRFSILSTEPLYKPDPDLLDFSKKDWEEITTTVFSRIFKKSAVKRIKLKGLQQNIGFLTNNT